ncbi:MAG TPA: imidazole glycerol phosphate synthase subunit HisH [Fluviicola sp.]|nr:imidazole glycerol phosphate synthase subunit HisH [Fluviicola sp.]
MIAIIDYGLGNLGSIKNMLKKIGTESMITSDPEVIANAPKLILPGVGAFDNGMSNLRERGLVELLNKKVLEEKTPILGICLGMQLFTNKSEEGELPGLGWIDAETVKFAMNDRKFPVPHMGWEYVTPQKESKLWDGMFEKNKFYFVHSYYVKCNQPSDVLLTTNYSHDYDSGFEKGNIVGVQFHPEKSHKYGMQLFRNFVNHY